MNIYRSHSHRVPGLNTASLPDLIFTVLFFFMIVTHMRKVTPKVRYQVPAGTSLTRLAKKSAVSYIYIGHPLKADNITAGKDFAIQLNDKYVSPAEVTDYMSAEKANMQPEDARQMTVSIKADRQTPMHIVTDVKQALRQAGTLRVSYSAVSAENKY